MAGKNGQCLLQHTINEGKGTHSNDGCLDVHALMQQHLQKQVQVGCSKQAR